jgi:hypothetical protein
VIEIESNIPIPKASGATKHREMYEAFDKMDVEQSFVVDDIKKIISLRVHAKKTNKEISYRKLNPEMYRVWRTR